ncbi:protein spaetzle [Agrilus planipennis]|uniref:Protein spaetzle n=1 Tax=Agrilus planipennis TaxID=224129 RepID=A0A1W4XD02_AGRPL|nr:protein spaetzle [Agrilus planipennis]
MDSHLPLEIFYCLVAMVFVSECFLVPPQNTSSTLKSADDSFLYASEFEEMQGHAIVSRTDSKHVSPFSQVLSQKGKRCIGDLCEGFDDYPHEEIKKILLKNPVLSIYFDDHPATDVIIEERFSDDKGETLCLATQSSIAPEKAKNVDNIDKVIVNTKEFRQILVTETCSTPNNQCRFLNETLPHYTTQCTQRYVQKRLWAVDDEGAEKITMDNFFIPSCCICELKRKDNP